ncbi:MAG: winged helix-turn-helix domain-containing protein [Thiolinea sp.]
MIVAKNKTLGSPSADHIHAVPGPARCGAPRGSSGLTTAPAPSHVDVTFRLPADQATDWLKQFGVSDLVTATTSTPSSKQSYARLTPAAKAKPTQAPTLSIRDLVIDPSRREVAYKKRAIPALTFTEFGILYFLARNKDLVFRREQIVEALRGRSHPVTSRMVDVQITGLRRKLGPASRYVQTVRAVGYRFKA